MENDNTVFIGAGQAAARCAIELRRLGYEGAITMYGSELMHPYQRPELSKSYLARPVSPTEFNVLSQEQADALDISIVTGAEVTQVDTEARTVTVNEDTVPFDKLVFACGGTARSVKDALRLRTLGDAEHLHTCLKHEKRLTVIGGGLLGLEVAATARAHGLDVTLYEHQERLGARSLPEEISQLLLEHQKGMGVEVVLGGELPADAAVDGVMCACIGITPNDSLAASAGIHVADGIIVNKRQMTSVPNIFAIGDCARESGKPSMENWAYANVSAERAAHAVCDIEPPVAADLWIWSKQGDLLLQMRGNYADADQCIVRRQGQRAAYFYLSDKRLKACIAINDPALFGQSRKLLRSGRQIDTNALSNPGLPLQHCKSAPLINEGKLSVD